MVVGIGQSGGQVGREGRVLLLVVIATAREAENQPQPPNIPLVSIEHPYR
jgi:hypothetical protein